MSRIFLPLLLTLCLAQKSFAANSHSGHGSDHQKIFHAFTFEADAGKARDGSTKSWDLDGWVGSDYNKLWLKSEGKKFGKYDKKSEVQALYSKNIEQFWDAQIGVRHDFKTDFSSHSVDYLTIGFEGLAPYFFETNAEFFVSDARNFSARLKQEIELRITQKLITQPYFEVDFFAQDVEKLEVRSGLSELEIGNLLRYEITHKFSPYLALRYNRKIFGTADLVNELND